MEDLRKGIKDYNWLLFRKIFINSITSFFTINGDLKSSIFKFIGKAFIIFSISLLVSHNLLYGIILIIILLISQTYSIISDIKNNIYIFNISKFEIFKDDIDLYNLLITYHKLSTQRKLRSESEMDINTHTHKSRIDTIGEMYEIMTSNGYHYFSGNSNSNNNDIIFDFSKLYNGRGDSISITITDSNEIIIDNNIKINDINEIIEFF